MAGDRFHGRRSALCARRRRVTRVSPVSVLAPPRASNAFASDGGRLHGRALTRRGSRPTVSGRSRCPRSIIGARRRNAPSGISRSARKPCRWRSFMPWRWSSARPPRSIAISGFCRPVYVPAIAAAAREIETGRLDAEFPLRRLADRVRHANQHECQRGDRQSRQ